ncbi:hypothetical protein GCM10009854_06540 [Saccharopolyspora halophila]|uniref:Uncharacterized protein n=1 Tax=Saccharopolyspora halophila TaxID=405551 RepID=A0ABN3FN22_9PSEU
MEAAEDSDSAEAAVAAAAAAEQALQDEIERRKAEYQESIQTPPDATEHEIEQIAYRDQSCHRVHQDGTKEQIICPEEEEEISTTCGWVLRSVGVYQGFTWGAAFGPWGSVGAGVALLAITMVIC